MPRVTPVDPDPDANAVVNSVLARTLNRSPKIFAAFARLDNTARFHGRLDLALKEEVRRATACDVGCAYCASLGPPPAPADARTAAAVELAHQIAEDPIMVTDEQFDGLREHFDEEEIVELVAFICFVSIAGQMFGAVMGLEAAAEEEAALYQAVLAGRPA